MKHKAVIFDLDGTLLYTLGDIARAVNTALNEFDMPSHPEESYKKFVGHGLKETLRRACTGECPDYILDKAYLRVMEEYNLNSVVSTKPYDDIPDLLNELTKCRLKLAILSNKEDSLVKHIVGELMSDWSFTTVQGTLPDVPKKPDSFVVYQILNNMDVRQEEALFVGDSGIDMKTAVNSGLLAVGVTWGYRDRRELLDAGAKVLIDKPGELLRIIDSAPG